MVTREQVYEVLRDCYDPEIPVNLVDMGLIYDVQIDAGRIKVVMTLTSRGCPAHGLISAEVRTRLEQMPGVESAQVEVVWDPPWGLDRMSAAARKQLGMD